ncbi:MAG TPA: hypothetical protein VK586_08235 [Streptosporangiaceae bacterium]|nr:hypothetical protein [Streptosporangiaceae bacterium]
MKIQWALMAEGITQDARGALTVVGLSQSVVSAAALPVMLKRAVVVLLAGSDDEIDPGQPLHFATRVIAPSGEAICAHDGVVPMAPSKFPGLPARINIASESFFAVKEYGRHSITVTVRPGDHPDLCAELEFYVTRPSDEAAVDSATFGMAVTHAANDA